ncbi:MAG: methyltransferase domain-containing protein, partial [Atopobiaceae bacterium]|nr:methyltransferase domain-containing protein [Atopobiaceae bacterium]
MDAKARSRDYFNLHHASRWAHEGYWSFDYKRSIQALELLRPANLIDIGCGPGGFLAHVQKAMPQLRLSAMDLSEGMVQEVRERFGGTVEAVVGDAEHMPLESDAFDAVSVNMSIHHWPHPQEGINEVFRILTPGGHLLLEDMDCILPIRAVANVVFPLLPGGDVKMYSQKEIR